MNNDQNNPRFKGRSIDVNELKEGDYNYRVIHDNGFYYFLCMHKYGPLLIFARGLIGSESKMGINYSWVDEKAMGRYINLVKYQEAQTVPAELVRTKYSQISSFFDRLEDVENKLHSGTVAASAEKEEELKSEINSHLIRLVNLLFHDLVTNGHAAATEAIENKLSLTICNNANNDDMFTPKYGSTKNDEWLHLTFSDNSYYLDETTLQQNDDMLYYMAVHKTLNHVIFARTKSPEFKTAALHHLYIGEDGLGRYKVQIKDGEILEQFFVPVRYVTTKCDNFREFMDDFKKLRGTSDDIYSKQMAWCILQDNGIHTITDTKKELERDLKQEIDKSLDLLVDSTVSPFPAHVYRFDGHYDFTVMIIKKKLVGFNRSFLNELYGYSRHNNTFHVIMMDYPENDVFYMDEKIRILTSKYDLDFYAMVIMGWKPKNNEIQQRVAVDYRNGNVAKLPYHEKTEVLMFYGKTKNSTNPGPDKSEVYEIIRERPNDEMSRILELRKFDEGKLDFAMEYHQWV